VASADLSAVASSGLVTAALADVYPGSARASMAGYSSAPRRREAGHPVSGRDPGILSGFLPEPGPVRLADFPSLGAAVAAVWDVLPQVITGQPLREMVGAVSEKLPHFDREAGG
jgi:hypothetical protein